MIPFDKERFQRAREAADGARDAGTRYAEAGRVIGAMSWLIDNYGEFVFQLQGGYRLALSHDQIQIKPDGFMLDDGQEGIEIPFAGLSSWARSRGFEGPGAAFISRHQNGQEMQGFIAPIQRRGDAGYRYGIISGLLVHHAQKEENIVRIHDLDGLKAEMPAVQFGRPIPITHVPDDHDAIVAGDIVIRMADIAYAAEDVEASGVRHYQFVEDDGSYKRFSVGPADKNVR